MKKYIFGAVLSLGILVSPAFTQAASLTSEQISAILGLLSSFGIDQQTYENVKASLYGGTSTSGGAQPWCHTFNTDLTVGSTGADVTALNQALTASGIDTTGVTSTYTEITASAVSDFQEKYKSEILTPNGLSHGTGYVGPATRAKLNALYVCGTTVTPSITVLSPTSGPVGTSVTIIGTGFTATNNSVKFGEEYLTGISSNGTTFTFKVPGVAPQAAIAVGDYTRQVPGWSDRPYEVHVPTSYKSGAAAPVVLVLHGGGGSGASAKKLTCPKGDLASPKCLNALADKEGFIVVYPNGTKEKKLSNARTWNAGGGKDGYLCSAGYACEHNIDDIAYFNALLNDLEKTISVDKKRIYATGISNGATMSNRLACELSSRVAAIASIAGGNQFSTSAPCTPSRPISVLDIHGTADPRFPYSGGVSQEGDGTRISTAETLSGWAKVDGCRATPESENLPDIAHDGTTVVKQTYLGCTADVVHYKIIGGGHTWPQGDQYLFESLIGKTTEQFSANDVMWAFFKAHPMSTGSSDHPGTYPVSVTNANGTSNVVNFTVKAGTTTVTPITLSSVTPTFGPAGTLVRLDGCGSDSTSGFTLVYTGPKSGNAAIPVETLVAASGCGYMTIAVIDFPVGTYTFSVKNNQTGAMSTNSMAFTVTAPAVANNPVASVSPTSFVAGASFTSSATGAAPSAQIRVFSTGPDGVTSEDLPAGTTSSSGTFSRSHVTTGWAAGTYRGWVTVNGVQSNIVTFMVTAQVGVGNSATDTAPPTVSITAPAGGQVGGPTVVSASASDNVGVTLVSFFLDGLHMGSYSKIPYAYNVDWLGVRPGPHILTAVARDAAGNTATSAGVTVQVGVGNSATDTAPPTVSITAPAGGSTVSGPITVSASASDNVGVVAVQFLFDGRDLGTYTTIPYAFTLDMLGVRSGAHTFTAIARDAADNSTMSAAVTVTVGSVLGAFSGATTFTYVWNRDLQIGSPYSDDVSALQQALTQNGVYAGEITGGFYTQTYTAVRAFQEKYGIDATGFVGSLTRSQLNTLFAR